MNESPHQRKRQSRADRIVANVGSRERAIRAQWEPMIRHCNDVLAHLEWLKDNPPTPEQLEAMGIKRKQEESTA